MLSICRICRSIVEYLSNPCRIFVEHLSNICRIFVDHLSKRKQFMSKPNKQHDSPCTQCIPKMFTYRTLHFFARPFISCSYDVHSFASSFKPQLQSHFKPITVVWWMCANQLWNVHHSKVIVPLNRLEGMVMKSIGGHSNNAKFHEFRMWRLIGIQCQIMYFMKQSVLTSTCLHHADIFGSSDRTGGHGLRPPLVSIKFECPC